jgi:hypothetical protein
VGVFRLGVLALAFAGFCAGQQLQDVKKVYFWPMLHSLDQYLAEQLSSEGTIQVVVDPKLADAIMTERIDAPFLKAMDEIAPAPESQEIEKAEDVASSSESVESGMAAQRPANRAMGRPRGTVFLVHVPTRKVLWSTFTNPKDTTPGRLHQQAREIAGRLRKDLRPSQ